MFATRSVPLAGCEQGQTYEVNSNFTTTDLPNH
jgi:hypothetical protein